MSTLRAALISVLLSLVAPPVAAQLQPAPDPEEDGTDLIQRGMQSILEGLFSEMQPAI